MSAVRRSFEGRYSRCNDAPQEGLSSRNELATPNHDCNGNTGCDVNRLDFGSTLTVRLNSHARSRVFNRALSHFDFYCRNDSFHLIEH